MTEPVSLYLIDASPYVFRAFYSLPDSITDTHGSPVNAVYGFATFLLKLIDDEQPSHLMAAFDGSLTTSFRNELYGEYKAQREPPPPELEAQFPRCRQVAEALGVATFIDSRYEADDIVATLASQHGAAGHRAVVVSSDKDLAQLVDERTELYDFAREMRYDPEAVRERFGVRPEQIPDYLGLAGDSVDNIPGVKGVGKKTALALLETFDTLEEALDDLDRVATLPVRGARSLGDKLVAARETALLSKHLATVVRHGPFETPLEALAYQGAVRSEVETLFEELGFDRIRERIRRWS